MKYKTSKFNNILITDGFVIDVLDSFDYKYSVLSIIKLSLNADLSYGQSCKVFE